MKESSYELVAISEQHLSELQAADKRIAELLADPKAYAAAYAAYCETAAESEEKKEKPYQVVEGVAIIPMKGAMLNGGSWLTKLFGITTYEGIRAALVEAVSDAEVQSILFDIDSPGGRVSGVSETATLVSKVDRLKPVYAYANNMMSAAYWLGSSARQIFAEKTAMVGSIGVVMTVISYQGAMEKAGIKAERIKSGKFKAVGSPEKDLTKDEKDYLQSRVDDLFAIFKGHVEARRPVVDPQAFDGSEHIADKAMAMGLLDRVAAFDDVLAHIINKHESNGGSTMPKSSLTAEQLLAAAASGAEITDPEADKGIQTPETAEGEANAGAEAGASAGEGEGTDGAKAPETPAASAASAASEANAGGDNSLTKYLEDKVTALQNENNKLVIANTNLTEDVEALQKQVTDLVTIAGEAINRMRVALGMAKLEASSFVAATVMADYNAISAQFQKSFKVGGLTTGAAPQAEKPKAVVTNIENARARSVGLK